MVAMRERAGGIGSADGLPARNAPPGRAWHPMPAPGDARPRQQDRMAITGIVLLVQEGRLRLLDAEGRGRVFLLSPEAAIEPQDLARLPGRRVRLHHHAAPMLMAGTVTAIEVLA
jgi:hypothetical protein